jgi:hypothetical protein
MVSNAPRLAAGLAAEVVAVLFFVGCSKSPGSNPPPGPPPPVAATTAPSVPSGVTALSPVFPISRSRSPCCRSREIPRWYVVQKTGSVRVFDNIPNVSTTREFINLSSRLLSDPNSSNDERGLLGMAFHPTTPPIRVSTSSLRRTIQRWGWSIASPNFVR